MFDAISSGFPAGSPYPAGSRTVTEYLDTNTAAVWINAGNGYAPQPSSFFQSNVLNTTATSAPSFVAPVSGAYEVIWLAIQATSTNGTLPTVTVTFTDAETGAVQTTQAFVTGAATTGQGQNQQVQTTLNLKAGSTVTFNVAAPTTLTANEKIRVSFLG